jgi:hypothetical protein
MKDAEAESYKRKADQVNNACDADYGQNKYQ